MKRLALGVAALIVTGGAFAHSALVSAEPAPRATINATKTPGPLVLRFNERVEAKWSSVTLGRDGTPIVDGLGKPQPKADDPTVLTVSLPPLTPGRYAVHYRVVSADGHVVNRGYEFTVVANPGSP